MSASSSSSTNWRHVGIASALFGAGVAVGAAALHFLHKHHRHAHVQAGSPGATASAGSNAGSAVARRSKPASEAEMKARFERASNHPDSDKKTTFNGWASLDEGRALEKFSYHPRPLGERDVEIAITHCGICASDLHTLDSGWGETIYPAIVGHEIVGTVRAVGSGVKGLKLGDRVGVGAQVLSCLDCDDCKNNLNPYCNNGKVFTYNSAYDDSQLAFGGYADGVRVHEEFAIKIPDSLPSDVAAPMFCAGATVYSPLKEFMRPGMTVGVAGIGGLGHLGLMFASALGAKRVVAISSGSKKKDDALKLGATDYVDLSDSRSAYSMNHKIDLLVVTAHQDNMSLDSWLKLLTTDGKLVLVGLPNTDISFAAFRIVERRGCIIGSAIASPKEIADMLKLAAEKNVRTWIEKLPMSACNEGVQRLRDGKARFRLVLENPK